MFTCTGEQSMVMEYLTGETLSQVIKQRESVPLAECLPLLDDLASALDYAHEQGVIHRDIKPSNVILEPMTTSVRGQTQRAILMDFGIARFVTENTMLTATGDVLGTADYISPEQAHGTVELDRRADLYSFAVMTYQLLTGHKPFERNNTWAMIRSRPRRATARSAPVRRPTGDCRGGPARKLWLKNRRNVLLQLGSSWRSCAAPAEFEQRLQRETIVPVLLTFASKLLMLNPY